MKIFYTSKGKKGNVVKLEDSDKLTNGFIIFYSAALADFPYRFDSLKVGDYMFAYAGEPNKFVIGEKNFHNMFP